MRAVGLKPSVENRGLFLSKNCWLPRSLNLRGFERVPVLKPLAGFLRPRAFFVACLSRRFFLFLSLRRRQLNDQLVKYSLDIGGQVHLVVAV